MRNLTLAAVLVFALVASLLPIAVAWAAGKDFNFKDPKGVNSMSFVLDSELEPMMGFASGISGKVSYDPKKPKKTSGELVVEASSLTMSSKRMTGVLHSAKWLDVEKFTTITFKLNKVTKVAKGKKGAPPVLTVDGEFTCHGVTKKLTADVSLTFKEGGAKGRIKGHPGDVLVLRTSFDINRKDYGIGGDNALVSDTIQIRIAIVGLTGS